MTNEKTNRLKSIKAVKRVFIALVLLHSVLYFSRTFAIDSMYINPFSKEYNESEIIKVTNELSKELTYFLKKKNKLGKVIRLFDILSDDYTEEELSVLFPIIKQELKKQRLNIIEEDEQFQNKIGLCQSPSYYLTVRLYYLKNDKNQEMKMISMKLTDIVSKMVIWKDDIYIFRKP